MVTMFDKLIHKFGRRPYKLHTQQYGDSKGPIVVLLHGLNSSKNNWINVVPHLPKEYNIILIDLIGFGDSPKPKWPKFDLQFHAKQVEHTLEKQGLTQNVILAGHSMGGLISIELARKNPNNYKGLILANTPLYEQKEVQKEIDRFKRTKVETTDLLFRIYEKFMLEKDFTLNGAKQIIRLAPKDSAFSLTKETWTSFEKSLKNAIIRQNSIDAVAKLKKDIIFMNGLTDVLVINKHQAKLAKEKSNIKLEYMPSGHMINKLAGKQIAKNIVRLNQKD